MKKLFFIGFWLFSTSFLLAQRHEIGVKFGTSNIVGDIGKTNYIQVIPESLNKTPLMIGISYKRNFNPYQGVKLALGYHSVYFNDANAKETYRYNRTLSNDNDILEGSLTFEYNFFPINDELRKPMFSPYIFGGISILSFDKPSTLYTVSNDGTDYNIKAIPEATQRKISGGIPFGLGLKYKFNYNWAIYAEATFRPTFSDDLDYNNVLNSTYRVKYENITDADMPNAVQAFNEYIDKNQIGNLNSKDWLNSISLGISYSFGRPPCYCN